MLIRKKIPAAELGDASRVWTPVDAIDINGLKGSIQIGVSRKWNRPRRYDVAFDDLWDLTEAMEAITLEHGGRIYRRQASVTNRELLALKKVIAGPISIAPTSPPDDWEGDQGFYLGASMVRDRDGDGVIYHNFFVHLEDLVALLHASVRDAQGLQARAAAAAVARTLH